MFSFYWSYINSILRKTFSFTKKAVIVVGTFLIIISLFLHFINKDKPQTTQPDIMEKNRQEIYKTINDPKLNSTKEGKASIAIIQSVMCGLVGEACTNNPNDDKTNFNKSLFGFMANLIALPYTNPPASGVYWVANGLQNTGFVPKTYAAGIGFNSIKGLMGVWKPLRDVAYMILVLVIVAVGFMIMFRTKINPQTVISIESALPKIVMALLYITFSFAIAGFMIDLMYVLIIMIVSILGSVGNGLDVPNLQSQYLQAGPGLIFGNIIAGNIRNILWVLPQSMLNLIPTVGRIVKIVGSLAGYLIIFPWLYDKAKGYEKAIDAIPEGQAQPAGIGITVPLAKIAQFIFQPFANNFFKVVAIFLGANFLIPLIIGLLILITVVFIFFRIFLFLFGAYTKIILYIIISPLYLMLEAVPGRSTFSSWIKNLASQLIVFPAAVAIFMMGEVLINNMSQTNTFFQLPFLYGIGVEHMATLISIAILFMTPDLLKTVQQLLVPKPMPLDFGFGSFFGGVSAGVGTYIGETSKYALFASQFTPFQRIFQKLPGFGGKNFGNKQPQKPPPTASG